MKADISRRVSARTYKIGLLLSENAEYGRGVLRGIADFSEDHPEWSFRVETPDQDGIDTMKFWKPDGMVVMLTQKALAPELAVFKGPIVKVCDLPGLPITQLVQSDDIAVGRLGAEHLMETGAETFGFVGLTEGSYVKVRADAFHAAITNAGRRCIIFEPLGKSPKAQDLLALKKWLLHCPKPLALMTSNDTCGRLVLETAREAKLHVPTELAVLGVDNEDPLSRLVWPGLSSISLATEQIGYRAAGLLHRLLLGQPPPTKPTYITPLGVVARRSTGHLPMKDPILSKVLTLIQKSVASALSVKDLVKHSNISRISLERLFRRHLNRTPLQEIRHAKIARARQLLIATDLPLKAIAERCGFAAPSRLIEAFQREQACSPTQYRKRLLERRQLTVPRLPHSPSSY